MNLVEKIEYAEGLIMDAIEDYHPKIAVACSFGKDSMVLVHLARQFDRNIKVFSVLTPFKPRTTILFKTAIVKAWNLNYSEYRAKESDMPVVHIRRYDSVSSASASTFIDKSQLQELWKTDPERCCEIYKVEPFKEAVKDLDCWISGIRAGEGRTRGDYKDIEKNDGLVKINPLLKWSEMDIWRYSSLYRVPQNPLYRTGLRSLGCEPCTHIVDDDAEERKGRWTGTSKEGGECGIHTKSLRG